MSVEILPVEGLPEIGPGNDLAELLSAPLAALGARTGDVIAVTQKVISKAEGRVVPESDGGRSSWVERETVRVVARRGDLVIAETAHGFVCANAGVDASNVEPGLLTLLPEDPDGSAAAIREGLTRQMDIELGVVITDTFGRPWRQGLVNVAIGCAGLPSLLDLRGTADHHGRPLEATVVAIADEIAAASGLVMTKAARVPAALLRGLALDAPPGTARELVRAAEEDLFRESPLQAVVSRRDAVAFGPGEVPREAIEEAVAAAMAVAIEADAPPWRFVVATSAAARSRVRAAVAEPGEDEPLATAAVHVVPLVPAGAEVPPGDVLLSSGAAVEALLLGLHAHALASRWIRAVGREGAVLSALGVDDGWRPIGVVAVGRTSAGAAATRPPPGLSARVPDR